LKHGDQINTEITGATEKKPFVSVPSFLRVFP
jgi:hypothetical protein